MRTAACIVVLCALVCATGCGTIQCLTSSGHWGPLHRPPPLPPNAVYGGVRWDLRDNPSDIAFWNVMNDVQRFLDLPFSFVADTLVLPYTLFSKEKRVIWPPIEVIPES